MRTYHRSHDTIVTSELFVRWTTSAKSYAIRDMRNVGIACLPGDGAAKLLVTIATTTGVLAVAVAAWAAGAWPTPLLFAVGVPAILIGALAGRRKPARWELRAIYRGEPVILYTSADVRVFNQVTRALRRAIEADRQPPAREEARPPDYAA